MPLMNDYDFDYYKNWFNRRPTEYFASDRLHRADDVTRGVDMSLEQYMGSFRPHAGSRPKYDGFAHRQVARPRKHYYDHDSGEYLTITGKPRARRDRTIIIVKKIYITQQANGSSKNKKKKGVKKQATRRDQKKAGAIQKKREPKQKMTRAALDAELDAYMSGRSIPEKKDLDADIDAYL